MTKRGWLGWFVLVALIAGCGQDVERSAGAVSTGSLFLNERVSLVRDGESRFMGGGCMQRLEDTGGGRAATLAGPNAGAADQLPGLVRWGIRWDAEGTAIVDVYDLQDMIESRSYPTSFVLAGMHDEFTIHSDAGEYQFKYWGGPCAALEL
jgi:hypothetical protein